MDLQYKKQVNCPDDEILFNYKNGTVVDKEKDEVLLHLLFCDACLESMRVLSPAPDLTVDEVDESAEEFEFQTPVNQKLLRAVDKFVERDASRLEQAPMTLEQSMLEGGFQVGQIWRTRADEIVVPLRGAEETFTATALNSKPHLVVITEAAAGQGESIKGYHVIKVAPISPEVEYAGEGDVTVDKSISPLGYSFLIEAWNEQPMLSKNLDACLASLNESKHAVAFIGLRQQLIRSHRHGERPTSVDEMIETGEYRHAQARWRANEYEETAYLRTPAEALTGQLSRERENLLDAAGSSTPNLGLSRLDHLLVMMTQRFARGSAVWKGIDNMQKRTKEPSPDYAEEMPLAAAMPETSKGVVSLQQTATEIENQVADYPTGLAMVSSIIIRDGEYEVLQDLERYAHLRGNIPTSATHVCLGPVCYELKRAAADDIVKIEGLGIIRLERFLREQAPDAASQQVEFVRLEKMVD